MACNYGLILMKYGATLGYSGHYLGLLGLQGRVQVGLMWGVRSFRPAPCRSQTSIGDLNVAEAEGALWYTMSL